MMAVDLHNCLPLLPSQFISKTAHVSSLTSNKPINQTPSPLLNSPSDCGYDLNSQLDSDRSSTVNRSKEENDYIAELTRQMAQYMLQDEDKHANSWSLAGSPQSTLWPPLGSDRDSPIGPSREPSPPLAPVIGNFEKMKIDEEIPLTMRNPSAGFQSKQALIENQIRTIQFYRLKQEQTMKLIERKQRVKQYQSKSRDFTQFNNGQKSPSSSFDTLRHQRINQKSAGPDKESVLLNKSGPRSYSSGTGVFLPRGTSTSHESRNKQGCSQVLIPARVVQALKLHFEKTGVPSRFDGCFPPQHDAFAGGRHGMYSQQKRQTGTVPATKHQEMCLPQEWTY